MDPSGEETERLMHLAARLAARVRTEPADTNGQWLRTELPDPQQWWKMMFILAAAVDHTKPWRHLTGWVLLSNRPHHDPDSNDWRQPCGTRAAAKRHRYHSEPIDPEC